MTITWGLPAPWSRWVVHKIGGLTAVGLSRNPRYLLVASWQGRGVFDLETGARVARDPDVNFPLDEGSLQVPGIGPIEGEQVRVAGFWGGRLPSSTSDGWRVAVPEGGLPRLQSQDGSMDFELPDSSTEVRAVGFSQGGSVLVYATASDVTFYYRDV